MKLTLVAVGKLKERALRELADDYVSRIRRYARFDEIEVKNERGISGGIPKGSVVVALEVTGVALSSRQLASKVEEWGTTGKGHVAFLIGGALGIPAEVSRAADHRISLSPLTLPHRLARLLLLEQIYRSMTLLKGEPYARED